MTTVLHLLGAGIFLFAAASILALGVHPVSYPVDAIISFPGSKAAGA